MSERALSKILEVQQRFVRNLTHLADGLEASGSQQLANSRRQFNVVEWRFVRQLWRWLEHIPVANAAYPASDNFDFISQLIKR
jgi:hypothetical protein